MPCVCLKNTFRHWQLLEAQAPASPKSARRLFQLIKSTFTKLKPTSAPTSTSKLSHKLKPAQDITDGIFSDNKVLRVPHPPRASLSSANTTTSPVLIQSKSGKPSRLDLINAESRLGSAIFGPVPEGHRREFFHDQQNIWIWYEDWQDQANHPHQMTVRYEVRQSGIYKKISAGKYFKLEGDELDNFRKATHAYLYMVKKYLYNRQPASPATQA